MRFTTALITLALVVAASSILSAQTASRAVAGEILVAFQPGVSAAAKADAHRIAGGRMLAEVARTGVQRVAVTAGQEEAAIARYQANPNVRYAQRNFVRQIPSPASHTPGSEVLPADYYFGQQWALHNTGQQFYCFAWLDGEQLCFYIGTADADIDAPEGWAVSTGGAVAVAVIDSGVDYTHPDLVSAYAGGYDFVSSDPDPMDDHGHGTHVAGTIAAALDNLTGSPAAEEGVVGVAPHARILAYKVCAADGSCTDFAIAQALARAITDGARVINMSLGSADYSQVLDDGVQDAWRAGLVIVAAAGNDGNTTPFYPAALPNVVSVGAFDEDDRRASFSNYGTWVDLSAPGNVIVSTYPMSACASAGVPGDTGCYAWMSGTSMAAPHVSGAAALVWSRGDVTSNSQVVDILLGSADPRGVDTVRLDSWTIHGGLNIHNALSQGVTNLPPVANAGPDQTRTDTGGDGSELVTLDGTGSSDPDGTIVSYVWREGTTVLAYGATPGVWLTVGTHTLTLEVTDNSGSTGTDGVVVTINPLASPTSVHVGDLDGSSGGNKSTWTARVTATVHDSSHRLVAGAIVTGTWSGGGSGSTTCTTGTDGSCQMSSGSLRKRDASVTFNVTGVTASGLTYASSQNHDPDGDSNGTMLSIAKP